MTRLPILRRPAALLLGTLLLSSLFSLLPGLASAQAPPPAPSPGGAAATDAKKKRPRKGKKFAPAAAPAPGAAAGTAPADVNLPPVDKSAEEALTNCPGRIPPGTKFKWDLRGEVELKDLVSWVTSTLCKPVIVPTTLRQQKVQIYAPSLITQAEAYRMLLAALYSMGITIQPEGNAWVLAETVSAKERALPFVGPDGKVPDNASFVTKVIRLDHVSTDDVLAVLQRLKSKDGDIIPYAPTGTLIITDQGENIRRMDEIIKMIDQPMGGEKIWVVKLRNTSATEVAGLLEKIFQSKEKGGKSSGGGQQRMNLSSPSMSMAPGGNGDQGGGADISVSLIIPDERTNMLIIVANEKTYQRMLALIHRLEQSSAAPVDAAADRIHIYQLANANADDIATTLGGLGVGVTLSKGGRAAGGTSSSSPGGQPSHGGAGAASGGLFEGDVRVASDKPTNSLVIVASGKDYYTLRDIIRSLDNPRRQVFIEATILEVSLDKSRKIGAAFHGGDTASTPFLNNQNSLIFGGSEPNQSTNSILFNPAALSGLAAGIRGPAIPGADDILGLPKGTSVPAFGVYLQAIQNNNDVNVVSMPHILTTDNEKANIEVGQNLPFPGMLGGGLGGGLGGIPGAGGVGGGFGGFGGGLGGFGTSVQRQDVALKLEITPHVSGDGVRLEIDNEISDVASPNYNGLGPATNKRKIKTQITVKDQQSVVLGGLIKDKVTEAVDKVPLLGDIPLLGYLFKFTRRSIEKQNLLVIITPYIIQDPSDMRRIFEKKIAERREFLERFSSFRDEREYEARVDYRHKRGLLEEINRTAIETEREAADLRVAEDRARGRILEGPVEPNAAPPPPPPGDPRLRRNQGSINGPGGGPAGAPNGGRTGDNSDTNRKAGGTQAAPVAIPPKPPAARGGTQ